MISTHHPTLQMEEASHSDAAPPLPYRPPYVNMYFRRKRKPSDSLQCAESAQQSSPSLYSHQLIISLTRKGLIKM